MARKSERLTDLAVRRLTKPGYHPDGRGLYLQVAGGGTRSWLFRFTMHGRERWMGLGGYPDVPLTEARDLAQACRRQVRDGVDPIEFRRAERVAAKIEAARAVTFRQCADAYIAAQSPGWKNAKHVAQWQATLDSYVHPLLGSLPVQQVNTELVLQVLKAIWTAKPETATRVRQRIEAVLNWATARQYRDGDNPARWRGHLDNLLPKRSRVRRVRHHPAMPYDNMPTFFPELRQQPTVSALALAFTILTAARSSEVRWARLAEFNTQLAEWTIPAERTKSGRPHRVPLQAEAQHILHDVARLRHRDSDLVFPGSREGRPMSENTMRKFLQENLNRAGLTVHGFRSTFRDWAAEQTGFPRELAEAALAHVIKDRTEAAYRRGDMFERRRKLMDAWAAFCLFGDASATVVPLRTAN